MQQNDYLIAKFGVVRAENEPLQVWGVIQCNIQFTPEVLLMTTNEDATARTLLLWLACGPLLSGAALRRELNIELNHPQTWRGSFSAVSTPNFAIK